MTDYFRTYWDLPASLSTEHGYYRHGEQSDGPAIAAAGLGDPECLQYMLSCAEQLPAGNRSSYVLDHVHDAIMDGRWCSPLLRAIERQRPRNIRLLLQHGALADGIKKEHLSCHARGFRRFCEGDRYRLSDFLVDVDPENIGSLRSQIHPDELTTSEIAERRATVSRFWAEPSSQDIEYSQSGQLMHSVLAAATTTLEIFDLVLEGGADTSAWTGQGNAILTVDEPELESSYLCTSTPLHTAIAAKNTIMLRTILDHDFNPNARALATGSQALTPTQYAMILGDTESLSILMSHPRTDLTILTPVFHVHINHFAAAQLRLDLLLATHIPLGDTPLTTLGHTLLHIACLPLDGIAVPANAPKIQQSIHDMRMMLTKRRHFVRLSETDWLPSGEWAASYRNSNPKGAGDCWSRRPCPMSTARKQSEFVKYIVSQLGVENTLCVQDVHCNTALHYLAASTEQNTDLVAWLRYQDGGDIWSTVKNFWGHTPSDLDEDRVAASKRQPVYGPGGRGAMRRGRGR